jgi:hypothetical protein
LFIKEDNKNEKITFEEKTNYGGEITADTKNWKNI